ncbi:MAG: hypothetical protein KGH65_04285 [Candidatus Micrarchaeota archaeon]|nr:hypothetical protein [Candidatus Micrarchaeota archaeon]
MPEENYECKACGLHYNTKELADKCYAWCSAHKSCSMEITKHSIEMSGKSAPSSVVP